MLNHELIRFYFILLKKNKMKMRFIFLPIIILLAACSSSKSNKNDDKTEVVKSLPLASQWILESFNDKGAVKTTKSSFIKIADDQKSYNGNAGCNLINGGLTVTGNKITFGVGPMTQMACDALQQEGIFMQNLFKTNNYKIVGGELFLYQDGNLLMTLESFR
jgi:heat shock protein HslJ